MESDGVGREEKNEGQERTEGNGWRGNEVMGRRGRVGVKKKRWEGKEEKDRKGEERDERE